MNRVQKLLYYRIPYKYRKEIAEFKRIKAARENYKQTYLGKDIDQYCLDAFDYYKCIFIHIPKAAGISVAKTLFGNYGAGHRTIQYYKELYTPYTFSRYFKFTFVRNPYSRLQSAFYFLKDGGFHAENKAWVEENLADINTFDEFVLCWLNEETMQSIYHFMPQVYYLKDSNGDIPLDFIGQFEHLDHDFKQVCKKLGIKNKELQQNNITKYKQHASTLSQEVKEKIHFLYKEDFDLLKYPQEL